jgi:hypothetical protein
MPFREVKKKKNALCGENVRPSDRLYQRLNSSLDFHEICYCSSKKVVEHFVFRESLLSDGHILLKGVNECLPVLFIFGGRDSSVGIATRYEVSGPGLERPGGGGARPAPGPIQPSVQQVPGFSLE